MEFLEVFHPKRKKSTRAAATDETEKPNHAAGGGRRGHVGPDSLPTWPTRQRLSRRQLPHIAADKLVSLHLSKLTITNTNCSYNVVNELIKMCFCIHE